MKDLVSKLVDVERKMSNDRGRLWLFALFLREDAPDRWDLLLSAPWTENNFKDALEYAAEKLKETLEPSELMKLSRVVIIDKDNPSLDAMNRDVKVEHEVAELRGIKFSGLPIEHAYIITSNSPDDVDSSVPAA